MGNPRPKAFAHRPMPVKSGYFTLPVPRGSKPLADNAGLKVFR
jgi:hypothetical protein